MSYVLAWQSVSIAIVPKGSHMWRFLLAGLGTVGGLALLFLGSYGDPTTMLPDPHPTSHVAATPLAGAEACAIPSPAVQPVEAPIERDFLHRGPTPTCPSASATTRCSFSNWRRGSPRRPRIPRPCASTGRSGTARTRRSAPARAGGSGCRVGAGQVAGAARGGGPSAARAAEQVEHRGAEQACAGDGVTAGLSMSSRLRAWIRQAAAEPATPQPPGRQNQQRRAVAERQADAGAGGLSRSARRSVWPSRSRPSPQLVQVQEKAASRCSTGSEGIAAGSSACRPRAAQGPPRPW